MARNKGRRGGKGTVGKSPGDRVTVHVAEPPARTVSHIGPDGRRVDTPIPPTAPVVPTTVPAKSTAVGMPVVAVRTSPTTAVVVRSGQTLANLALTKGGAKAEPFKLLVEAVGPDSPNVCVSWCLSPATVTDLRDEHEVSIDNTRMLLLITREVDGMLVEVERRLVALGSLVEYLRFNQPGLHRIHGFIVWSNLDDEKMAHAELFDSFVDNQTKQYVTSLTDGMTARIAANVLKLKHVAEHMVDVPSAFFAKKPTIKWWPWLAEFWWWFTNLWFGKQPVDQCAFRERWLFWTLPKLVMIPLYCILTMLWRGVCALFLLLIGRRPSYMKFKPIWRPFDYEFAHIIDAPNHRFFEAQAYIWLMDSKERPFSPIMWPIRIPLVWIGAAIGSYYIHQHFEFGGGMFYLTPMLVVSTIVAWTLIILTVVLIAHLQNRSIENEPARQEQARRWEQATKRRAREVADAKLAQKEAERRASYTQLVDSALVCDTATTTARPPTVWDIPWARRSLRLIFQHAKAKICKPYAK